MQLPYLRGVHGCSFPTLYLPPGLHRMCVPQLQDGKQNKLVAGIQRLRESDMHKDAEIKRLLEDKRAREDEIRDVWRSTQAETRRLKEASRHIEEAINASHH